jgi:hypothetical protein
VEFAEREEAGAEREEFLTQRTQSGVHGVRRGEKIRRRIRFAEVFDGGAVSMRDSYFPDTE